MDIYPKITIVTPCLNMVDYIEETILSVLSQNYPNLEYIIMDGGSTDGSIEIIKKYEARLFHWESETDHGMYHAIQKGFSRSSGEIMGWINSDDILHGKSLFVIAKCFTSSDVNWLQGLNTVINKDGWVIATRKPFNTSKLNFLCLDYLANDTLRDFGTIQQESTFWRRTLWERVGGLNLDFKYAGDFALWMSFFRHEKLFLIDSLLGAFRVRKDQISSKQIVEYIRESLMCINDELNNLPSSELNRINRFRYYKKTNSVLKQILLMLDKDYRQFVNQKRSYIYL